MQTIDRNAAGLLLLRVSFGGLMMYHGIQKTQSFNQMAATFPDPVGMGGHVALGLVIFAELICGALIVIGLLTRMATIPVIVTMTVAYFQVHARDPFEVKELALVYLLLAVCLLLLGAGDVSADKMLEARVAKRGKL